MAFEMIEKYRHYTCLTTDEKITDGIDKGSYLYEIDSANSQIKRLYRFDGTQWVMMFADVRVSKESTYRSSNSRLLTVDTTVGGVEVVPANLNRHNIIIQNQGIVPILIKFGGAVSVSDYDMVLYSSSENRNGEGGVFESDSWEDSIYAITETSSSILSIFEEEVT